MTLKKGPFGHYVQLGAGDGEVKPKRVALPRSLKPADVDLDTALRLLALPRELGRHPETGEVILAGIGRFGPYIKHGSTFKSLTAEDDVLTIGANRAVVLLAEPAGERRRGAPQPLRELGPHPEGGVVALFQGRYGPYVGHDGVIASLPREANPETFTLEQAIPLLAARREKSPKRPRKAAGPAKAGAAKAKKAPARKAAKPAAAVTSAAGGKARRRAKASRRRGENEKVADCPRSEKAAARRRPVGLDGAPAASGRKAPPHKGRAALGKRGRRFYPREPVSGRQARDRPRL